MENTILHLDQVDLAYSKQSAVILKKLNLKVRTGERVLLIGENGIGKTLLLKTISGLLSPRSGEVLFHEKNLNHWPARDLAKYVAFVGNHTIYNELLSVKDFIAFGRYPFNNWMGKLGKEDSELIQKIADACGINQLYQKSVREISDGERQKIVIARALIQQTELLILDEPISHLDLKNALKVLKMLKTQVEENKKSLVFSSHDISTSIQIADTLWLCYDNTVKVCSPEEFLSDKKLQQLMFGDYIVYEKGIRSFKVEL